MSSLKEKSQIFKDSSLSYYEKSLSSLELIDKDCSGAFWHKTALKNFIETNKFDEIKDSKLSGLTIGVKDLFCINGLDTTAGSKILEGFKSPYSSTVWERFKNKGVVLAGKTSMDEFAMGSFTNTSYLGKCSIPDRCDYSAGGSSGGSAAAVAGGFVDFSIGSDTGGSVRQPASFCGIVGFKPSYGGMSRFGMIAYASSLDQAGIMTKDLNDLDFILSEKDLFLHDNGKDMTCVGLRESEVNGLVNKVGYFKFILDDKGISEDVKSAYLKLLNEMEGKGIELVDVSIEYMKYVAEIYYIIACSEASSNLARYQGIFYGKKIIEEKMEGTYWDIVAKYRSKYLGEEVQRRIMLGSFILSSENYTAMYQKACSLRNILTKKLNDVLENVDLMILPTSPTVALRWDEISKMTSAQIYLADFMTVPFSLAGLPALSAPWFKNKDGLGIGMQLVGKRGNDFNLVRKALMLEKSLGLSKAQVV